VPVFIEYLSKIEPRRRSRVARVLYGSAALRPSSDFLAALRAELGAGPNAVFARDPAFFSPEIELDAVFAAAVASSSDPSARVFDDRRGMLEMDGIFLDAALAFIEDDGTCDLVLASAKLSGKWSGRRFRRLSDRLRRVFGEDGTAFPSIRPRFVALGPARPGPAQTAAWPAWMRRADGAAHWLPFEKEPDELFIQRCDKWGKPRRIGTFWRFDTARRENGA